MHTVVLGACHNMRKWAGLAHSHRFSSQKVFQFITGILRVWWSGVASWGHAGFLWSKQTWGLAFSGYSDSLAELQISEYLQNLSADDALTCSEAEGQQCTPRLKKMYIQRTLQSREGKKCLHTVLMAHYTFSWMRLTKPHLWGLNVIIDAEFGNTDLKNPPSMHRLTLITYSGTIVRYKQSLFMQNTRILAQKKNKKRVLHCLTQWLQLP